MASSQQKGLFGLGFVFACMLFVDSMDSDDQVVAMDDYCQMVDQWDQEKQAGVPEMDRAGHPNYKDINCN